MSSGLHALDKRIIYFLVILAISVPIMMRASIPPAKMESAELIYNLIENLEPGKNGVALVAFDFGPNTKAENEAQAEVIVEHLFRKRIPVAIWTLYPQAEGFLTSIPERVSERLMREFPGKRWDYGIDWVNLGYKPGGILFVQSFAKADNLPQFLAKDYLGNSLERLPAFKKVRSLEDVKFLAQFTGLTGVFNWYIQFFQKAGYVPPFGHGCTSITIPEAYIYLDSGQLSGLLEGIAGAAWYAELLNRNNPGREGDNSQVINTALGVAHLLIILLIIFGNLSPLIFRRRTV